MTIQTLETQDWSYLIVLSACGESAVLRYVERVPTTISSYLQTSNPPSVRSVLFYSSLLKYFQSRFLRDTIRLVEDIIGYASSFIAERYNGRNACLVEGSLDNLA